MLYECQGGRGYDSAKALFTAVREAVRDAQAVSRQLAQPMPERRAVMLRARLGRDGALVSYALDLIHGGGGFAGLPAAVPSWWADVLDFHHVQLMSWEATARRVAYSPQRCRQVAGTALFVLDGMAAQAHAQG